MNRFDRREFLKTSLAAGLVSSLGVLRGVGAGESVGANDRINAAVIGIHGQGGGHIGNFLGMQKDNVELIAICDVDQKVLGQRADEIEKKAGKRPQTYVDLRKLFENKDVHVVSTATPNHWHSLVVVWGCQAGKDVYVEKPCSHNVFEGRMAVEAARKYGRIVQHGTQRRAGNEGAKIAEIARKGTFGKLLVSRGLCYKSRGSIGFKPTEAPPKGLDFNLWLGPAPDQPYHANLVHYNWHWFWDSGCGDIGNQGVHEIDAARWAIPGATLPKSVLSVGGRYGYKDQGQTPNTQIAIFDYGETQLIFEVRGLKTDKLHDQGIGNVYHFEQGYIAGGKFFRKGSEKPEDLPRVDVPGKPGGGIFGNFIAAVRSRKREDLCADILEGHYSSALCHLANISYRLGKVEPLNPKTKALGDNKEAYETLARMDEHLKVNYEALAKSQEEKRAKDAKYAPKPDELVGDELKFDGLKLRVGRKLEFDPEKEKFVNDAEADKLLTRVYRKPFEVPEKEKL